MTQVPIRTAVRLGGDLWALRLNFDDPRGHRTAIVDDHGFNENCASRRYFAMREFGKSIAESARIVQVCADGKYRTY